MSVFEPTLSNPWGWWESAEGLAEEYGVLNQDDIKARMKVQGILNAGGFIAIPFSSGIDSIRDPKRPSLWRGDDSWTEGVHIYDRANEYDLSKSWHEDGELFGEVAESEFDNWSLVGRGSNHITALEALAVAAQDFVDNGSLDAEIKSLEEGIKLQERKAKIETDALAHMRAGLKLLKGRKS